MWTILSANPNSRGSFVAHENGPASFLFVRGYNLHGCLAICGVQGGGRLVGENRSIRYDGPRYRNSLLLAAAELARERRHFGR